MYVFVLLTSYNKQSLSKLTLCLSYSRQLGCFFFIVCGFFNLSQQPKNPYLFYLCSVPKTFHNRQLATVVLYVVTVVMDFTNSRIPILNGFGKQQQQKWCLLQPQPEREAGVLLRRSPWGIIYLQDLYKQLGGKHGQKKVVRKRVLLGINYTMSTTI